MYRKLLLWVAALSLLQPLHSAYSKPAGKATAYSQPSNPGASLIKAYLDQLQRIGRGAGSDRASIIAHMRTFYAALGYRNAWTNRLAVQRLVEILEDTVNDGLVPSDYHLDEIRAFYENPPSSPSQLARADLLMTDAVLTLMSHMRSGKVYVDTIEPNWNITPAMPGPGYDKVVMSAIMGSKFPEMISALRPSAPEYVNLRKALARYRKIQSEGGWQSIPTGEAIDSVGVSDSRIPAIRQRLLITGDLDHARVSTIPGENGDARQDSLAAESGDRSAGNADGGVATPDHSEVYDPALFEAVKSFQERHGLQVDGVIGNYTIKSMNVPVSKRIDQIRLNLERYRWYLNGRGSTFIMVNIPSFTIDVVWLNRPRWHSRVIVGKPDRQTPIFKAQMQYLIFNPRWVVPPGILIKDAIPAIIKDRSYLDKKNLTVVSESGQILNPAAIDWRRYANGGFPYRLIQDAGDEGSLGRIKFMLPNRFMVYLHDTPSKELFNEYSRTFSSGCVRVENPVELAEIVLQDPVKWSRSKIRSVIDRNRTSTVNLPRSVPVFLTYQTAFADPERVQFRADVYDKDSRLLEVLSRRATSRIVEVAAQ